MGWTTHRGIEMKKILLTTLVGSALFMSGCIGAGEISTIKYNGAGQFPSLTGIDLHGQEREIPKSFRGELNIVAVAFQRQQQKDVDTWIPKIDAIIERSDVLKFYEIPIIYEVNMANRMFINNGMRAGIEDDKARSRTITVYTSREDFIKFMSMEEDDIYILLLNKDGEILWRHKGAYDADAFKALNDVIKDIQR